MIGYLLPTDRNSPEDRALMAALAQLNTHVTRYILRHLDADARRAEPMSVQDERALAERLTALAAALQARADRREALGGGQPLMVEGDVEHSATTDDSQEEQP